VNDAVSRFRAASEAHDVEAMMATVAPDAELVSPISGRLAGRRNAPRAVPGAKHGANPDVPASAPGNGPF